jgi:hypothetical protein
VNPDEVKRVFERFHLLEALHPASWHWVLNVETGWFLHHHHPENAEELHISAVRDKLSAEDKALLDKALRALADSWRSSGNPDAQKAVAAIGLLLGERQVTSSVWSPPDIPVDLYTEKSSENLIFPKMVEFTLANGSVLQSAREAVIYRMHVGKEDLNYWYLTRTAAIYYRKDGELFVAFDDDSFDNILLTSAEEGRKASSNWLVDKSRVQNAIIRAERTGRTIRVASDRERSDAMDVAKCMVGDKAEAYEQFLRHCGYKCLRAWAVSSSQCDKVSENQCLIRCVGVSCVSLLADYRLNDGCRARGVRKIFSTGNRGYSVQYIGLLLFQQLGHDDPGATKSYFDRAEHGLTLKEQGAFYAGLAFRRDDITSMPLLDAAVAFWHQLAPAIAPAEHRQSLFSAAFIDPWWSVWGPRVEAAARFSSLITKTKQKTKAFVMAMERINRQGSAQSLLPFFIYLVEERPKQLLDILSTHTLLYVLEEGFLAEMGFFTAFAKPLTGRSRDFASLRNLTAPIGSLDPRVRELFLARLNTSAHTIGAPATLFQELDLTTHSFTDAAYLLFALLKNDNIEKARKKLQKLQQKENKLQKLIDGVASRDSLNEQQGEMLERTLQDISNQFFDLVLDCYASVKLKKLIKILSEKFDCHVLRADKKAANPSFLNALQLLKNIKGEKEEKLLLTLIQHYLGEETVPFKPPSEAYPRTLPANKEWLSRHDRAWQEPYKETYEVAAREGDTTNIEQRREHHLDDARGIISQLHIEPLLQKLQLTLTKLDTQRLDRLYRALAKEADKHDKTLLKDLKTQLNALRSLQGVERGRAAQSITIESEFDSLEILQMGNYVAGSCLNVNGAYKWSAVVNACEANKRVLYARDEHGNVIGRVLIAVDNNDRIVRFPVYYATSIPLDEYFNDYIKKLAERCKLSLNGNADNVQNLIASRWYHDAENNI